MKIIISLILGLFLFFETTGNSSVPYTATAYALRGRTASGLLVRQGIIAADVKILPLGTTVFMETGAKETTGNYLVADTGAKIRGHRVDIWMNNVKSAKKFGVRKVHITVLNYGNIKAKRKRSLYQGR